MTSPASIRRTKRVAILRPFSTERASNLKESFDTWSEYLPCKPDGSEPTIAMEFDLFLSYSQSYDGNNTSALDADKSTQFLIDNFQSFPWSKCFQNVYRIETNTPEDQDLYLPSEMDNPLWVNGPNQQFVKSMNIIQDFHVPDSHTRQVYDYVFVMESDVLPIKVNWLKNLMEEAQQKDFCMLGSKYAGEAWNGFRSSLPLALQHHLNGNSVYNLRHPLMKFLLKQLLKEKDTIYNSVPYDYRIAQILVEGFLGVEPALPAASTNVRHHGLHDDAEIKYFRRMWNRYGMADGEAVMIESKVIKNYVGSPLLPRHIKTMEASLIHGAMLYSDWKKNNYVSSEIVFIHLKVAFNCNVFLT